MKEIKEIIEIKKEMMCLNLVRKSVGSGKTKSADSQQVVNMTILKNAKR